MRDSGIHVRQGSYLPHWTKAGAVYHVRVRLADSVPQSKLREWKEEREELLQKHVQKKITTSEKRQLDFLFSQKVEKFLDAGYGNCWLRKDAIAEIVANAFLHFNEERYKLFAWCIMPNHYHVIFQHLADEPLHKVLRSWKSFTTKEVNKTLGSSGEFWQREYFDHLIRNTESLKKSIEYVWSNPDAAGLMNWKWRWKRSAYIC